MNWNTPENWSGDVLPGSNDDVTINIPGQDATISNVSGTIQSLTSSEEIVIQGGTLDIAASSSIAKLTHVSGTLTGTGNIDVIGDYVWQTGTLSGEATLSVHGGLKLREAGAFNNDWHLYARTLVNLGNGDATGLFGPEFTTARMFFHDGAEFQNAGSFAIETTVGMRFILADATGSRIVNSGNFFNATSDVSTSEGVLFENSGSLSVSSGQLQLAGGFTNAGSCHIDEGTTLLISGLFESESTANITGTGHLYLQYATQRGSVMAGGDVTLDGTTIEGDFGVAGNLRDLGAAFNGSPVLIGGSASIEGDWLGTGEVTINGLMTWNIGAWINGTGTIVANGGMHITGSGISRLTGMTIENAGVAIFDGGLIEGYNGSVIHNLPGATFEIRNDADIYDIGGAAQVRFDNDGTFQKLTGADVASVNFQFNNSGTVEVQSGQLVLNGGGTSTGDFLVGSGATLFASGEFSATSDITGAGDLTLDGTQRGTVNIGGNVTLSGVIEGDFNVGGDLSVPEGNGATFNGTPVTIGGNADVNRMFGTGDVTIAGLFTWNLNGVAQMFGTGRTIANGGMLFAGNGLATLQQRTIVNAGVAVFDSGTILASEGSILRNLPGASFEIRNDADIFNQFSGPQPLFDNQGTFLKLTGTDIAALDLIRFDNSGTVAVQSGQLVLNGGGTSTGDFLVGSGATLFASGEFSATSDITGAGDLTLDGTQRGTVNIGGNVTLSGVIEGDFNVGGDLSVPEGNGATFNGTPVTIGGNADVNRMFGTGDVTIAGLFTWNLNGVAQMFGTGRTIANGGMLFAGNGLVTLQQRTIVNAGVAVFDSGTILASEGSILRNLPGASFEIRNDADIFNQFSGPQPLFDNQGTFLKLTGTDIAALDLIRFDNSGTVAVQSGQLVLNGGGTSTGDFLVGSGATLFASGEFSATSDITGAGDLTLDGTQRGTVNIGGNVTLSGVIEGDFNVGGDLSVPEGNGATFNGTPVTIGGNADVNRMFGTGDVTIAGLFTWNLNGVAQMFGTGRTIANGGMLFAGNGLATLQQRTIVNAGNAVWTGAAIYIANNAQIINTGTFDIQSDGPLNSSSECPVFTNSGQLIKSAGDGTTYLNMLLVNSGSVVVQTGILNIGCGYVPDGGNVVGSVETSEIVNPGSFVVVPSPPITIGNFTQTATGELFEQIGGLIPGTEYGQIAVNGTVNLDGLLHVTLLNGFSPQLGDQFTIINNQGTQPINGTFFGLSEGLVIWSGNYGFTVTYSGGDGNDFVLTMDQFANQAPVFSQANYQFTINSKSLIAATVGTAPAADPDSEDVLTYSIEGGNTQGAFAIDPATGQISVANPAKLPKIVAPNTSVDAPVLTILASDGSLVDTAVVTITLQAAPQAMAPIAAARVVSFNLRENTLAGATAATVSGSPAYTGQSFANWTISDTPGGPASSIFYLKSATATGVVIGVNSMLSYEDASSYTIYVTVSDSLDATRTMTSAVTIHITDVNEAPQLSLTDGVAGVPTVTSGTPIALVAKYTINEYRMSTAVATPENGDLLFTLNAHDDDQSDSSLLYALTGTGVTSPSAGVFIDKSGAFRFDAATGKIIVIDATKLDYEKFRAGVPLVFSVTDNGLPGSRPDATPAVRTSRATVTILLNDLNDAPTFASPTLSVSRPENNPGSAVLFSLRATDGDVYDGVTQSLTYSLVSVLDGLGMDVTSLFTISLTTNPTTGLFTGWVSVIPAKLFDFEVMARNTFIFTVRATEDAAGGLSTADSVVGDQVITMNITDLNEAPTAVFTPAAPGSGSQSSGTTGSVTVNLADMNNGTVIGLFSFSDPDVWAPSLTYGPDSLVVFSVVDSSSSTAPALSYVANADPITGGSLRISNMTTLQSRIGKPFVLRITVKDKQGLTGALSIRLTLTINVINEVGNL